MFVGGAVTALYPLEGGIDVRPTVDVDCVVEITTAAAYYAFVDGLRDHGFRQCTDEGAPLCRLVLGEVRVDILPSVDTPIGPTNRWYREAIASADWHEVAPCLEVLAITPIYFVATKLQAFRDRGRGDYQASHDLEDILSVVAGLPLLRKQIATDNTAIAVAVRNDLVALRAHEAFIDAVPAHFEGDRAGQARADLVLDWLASLAP
jgi:predicted nucleotidyltransferase